MPVHSEMSPSVHITYFTTRGYLIKPFAVVTAGNKAISVKPYVFLPEDTSCSNLGANILSSLDIAEEQSPVAERQYHDLKVDYDEIGQEFGKPVRTISVRRDESDYIIEEGGSAKQSDEFYFHTITLGNWAPHGEIGKAVVMLMHKDKVSNDVAISNLSVDRPDVV